ncbi:MAG: hypothetical protein LBT81_02450 [Helicobacteraceae bacterium]|nr:hypothetical protein [Helicobacteraceae bacterium]
MAISVSVVCESALLRRALEWFLRDRIATANACELIITDRKLRNEKPQLIIGEHLVKPFSGSQLDAVLERFDKLQEIKTAAKGLLEKSPEAELEAEIERLMKRFSNELLGLLKKK